MRLTDTDKNGYTMDFSTFANLPIIDCHVHFDPPAGEISAEVARFAALMERVMQRGGISQAYISGDWSSIGLKARCPGRFYAGGKVAWSGKSSGPAPDWKAYLDALMTAGFDGIGETGSKPAPREQFTPLAGPYYAGLWRYCESRRVPILCHVADPEEFWDESLAPQWARERHWTYDQTFPSKEDLYADLQKVLDRHPEMSLVLAHFNFLSADLERASTFFSRYAHVAFDLTPGIELLYNMSKRRDEWRDFFKAHQDRILFGTDIMPWQTEEQALARIWVLRMLLESSEEFFTPPEADDLMTRYETPFHGLALDKTILAKVYAANFQRIFGRTARPTDVRTASALAAQHGDAHAGEMLSALPS